MTSCSSSQWPAAADPCLLKIIFSSSKCQNTACDSWIPAAGHSQYTQVSFYLKFLSKNSQIVEPWMNNAQFKFRCQVPRWCLKEQVILHLVSRPVLLWGMNYRQPCHLTPRTWHWGQLSYRYKQMCVLIIQTLCFKTYFYGQPHWALSPLISLNTVAVEEF